MSESASDVQPTDQLRTSLGTKLLNIFVCPGEVFEEIACAPPRMVNWIVPTALVSLSCLATVGSTMSSEGVKAAVSELLDSDKMTQAQAVSLSAQWENVSRATILIAPFGAVIWSAFVLWFIGRVFLKSSFAFRKALEVTALCGTILIFGAVVTWLLVAATGDASARPALSLLCLKLPQESTFRNFCGLADVIQLWTTVVLAVGLSKLAGATFKESAFWVFGYWLVVRSALVLLG